MAMANLPFSFVKFAISPLAPPPPSYAKSDLVKVSTSSSPGEEAVQFNQKSEVDILTFGLLSVYLAVFFVNDVDTHDDLLLKSFVRFVMIKQKRVGVGKTRSKDQPI